MATALEVWNLRFWPMPHTLISIFCLEIPGAAVAGGQHRARHLRRERPACRGR